jgi:hypothetical protein
LAEAVQAKIPVIASELDFVRDILDPVETFDPHSSVSIYRAILRFLNIVESKSQQINSVELLNFVLQN